MADTFDPYDENDVFDAASLNTRFSKFKETVNAVPLQANQANALGPPHISSLLSNTKTQTKVLTPKHAKAGEHNGQEWFCDPIAASYPGFQATAFETALPKGVCWQRISDSSGGSAAGTTYLEVNTSGLILGENYSSLLVMANVEFCAVEKQLDNGILTVQSTAGQAAALVTVISTVSSTGVRTFYWETLRYTTLVMGPTVGFDNMVHGYQSVDVSHRILMYKPNEDIQTIQVLAATLDDFTAATGANPSSTRCRVRFCQLTAVALHAKVN